MILKDRILLFGAGMSGVVFGAMSLVQKYVPYSLEPTKADCIIFIGFGFIYSIYQLNKIKVENP